MTEVVDRHARYHLLTRVRESLLECFGRQDLRMLVHDALSQDLESLVVPGHDRIVVFELVRWCNRNGRLIDLLTEAASRVPGKPELADLRDECQASDRDYTAPPPALTLKEFRTVFDDRRPLLGYLSAAKTLHEVLHELDKFLPQLEKEVESHERDGVALTDDTADQLRGWVAQSSRAVCETEHPDSPPFWVQRLDRYVMDLLGPNRKLHRQAFKLLALLPAQQLSHLNTQLVNYARGLDVEELVHLLDRLPVGQNPRLQTAAEWFSRSCVEVSNLIRDHDLCQWVDTELRAVSPSTVFTSDDVYGWDEIRAKLARLAANRPGDYRATRTLQAADAFDAAPSANTFLDLWRKFEDMFQRIDKTLFDETGRLLRAALDLTQALEQA